MINFKAGDFVYSRRDYIDTEIVRSLRNYTNDSKLVHLIRGHRYKIISLTDTEIEIVNEFGLRYWYNITFFDKIKELRRQKIINIQKLSNENTLL